MIEELRDSIARSARSNHVTVEDMNDYYFRNPLSAASLQSVEQHLKTCEACRGRLRRFEETFPDRVEPEQSYFSRR